MPIASTRPTRTFSVTLSSPTNATLSAAVTGTGTITDDDAAPTITIGNVALPEGDSGTKNFVFTVSLSGPSGREIMVEYDTGDAGATAGSDYTAASGTLTFAPGVTTQVVTVAVNGDTATEPNENFTVALSNPTNASLDTVPVPGTGTILNDDGPHISFTTPTVSHLEGNSSTTQFIFTVTIGSTDTNPVFVNFSTQNGTATTADNDYVANSGTLTFNPGTLTQDITVLVNGDTLSEVNETFKVVLSNPSGNATISQDTATGTIQNDDAVLLGFANNNVTQTEGDSGTTNMLFTVTLTGGTTQTVTVQFDLQPGTATTPGDYTNVSGTLTFAPGVTSQIITVPIVGDLLNEADETFTVRLFNSVNAGNATSLTAPLTATGTIDDNDPLPSANMSNVSHAEGNSGTTQFVFTASLSTASGQTILLAYTTHDDTATVADGDYVATSGTLTFLPGQTTQTVTVLVNGDTKFEPTELFDVNLTAIGDNVNLTNPSAFGNIANDDTGPSLTIGNATAAEGNAGTTNFLFTVTLTNPSGSAVNVNYATAPGTAATGTDFVGQTGTLTFGVGVTQQVITIAVNGDTLNEADETFSVNLTSPTGAVLGGQTVGTGTITNDDAVPSLSIGNVTHAEGDAGLTPFVFVVNLSALSGQTVTVAYTTGNGSATTGGNDYQATSGTLTFGPGVTTANITVNVVGDLFQEPDENFFVTLSSPVNATLANTQGTGTIQSESTDSITFTSSSISGYAFVDVNGNGTRDTLERVLPGVAVTLTGTSNITNTAVTQQTTSGADGSYTFVGLDPGTYAVTFQQPHDYLPANVAVGSQGGTLLASGLGFNSTIANPGGVSGVENRVFTRGLRPEAISQREFLASSDSTPPAAGVSIAIKTITNPIGPATLTNVTVSGTGSVGATISVTAKDNVNTTDAKTTTVGGNGTWSVSGIDVTTLNQGSVTFSAKATLGTSSATSTLTSLKDTLGPAVAVSTVTSQINSTTAANTSASGTGEPGARISLVVTDGTNTTSALSTTINGTGTWSITGINVSSLANGTITYKATATDAAGNPTTATKTATKDTVAPAVAVTTVTNPVNNSNVSSASASGTAEAGAGISLVATDGTHTITPLTTTADANGNWTINDIDVTSLNDGSVTFTVTAKDTAGNTGSDTETTTKNTLVVDMTSAPSSITNVNQANLTVSGTGEVGANISVVASDGTHTATGVATTVGIGGTWSVSGIDVTALVDGTITFTVTSTDSASNTATDHMAGTKVTLSVALTVVTDPVNNGNVASANATGTGKAGATISVVVTDGSHSTAPKTATVDSLGAWTVTGIDLSSLDDGTITFNVTSTDSATNTANASKTAVKDTLNPNVDIAERTNPVNNANVANAGASGTGEAGAGISVTVTDGTHTSTPKTTTVAEGGTWSVTGIDLSSLNDGTITYTVTATDVHGNTKTDSITATKDTLVVDLTTVTNPVNNTNLTNAGASGTGEEGATISVVATDGTHTSAPATTTVIAGGTWSVSGMNLTDLTDGTITFTVTSTDTGSNTATDSLTALKDTLVPDVAVTDRTDPVHNTNVTNAGANGTGEVGAGISVTVSDGTHSSTPKTTTVAEGGTWSVTGIDLSGLDDGEITYTVTATDIHGNTKSSGIIANKDTLVVDLTTVTNPVNNSTLTNAGASGTGEVGATISVVATDGTHTSAPATTTVIAGGTWSVTGMNLTDLTDGTITFTVTSTDTGSNTATDSLTALKDTLVPDVAITSRTNPVSNSNVANAGASGTGEVGAGISVTVSDGTHASTPATTTVIAGGTWSVTGINLSSLDDGTITYSVTATDIHGNTKTDSITATKDTLVVDLTTVTNPVNNSTLTNAGASGTGEVGATISVVATDGTHTSAPATTTVIAGGTWAVSGIDLSSLVDGTVTFTVTSTDTGSNTATDTLTSIKDTLVVDITTVTNPIKNSNVTAVSANGTGELGANIAVVASDGTHTSTPATTTVVAGGTWTVSGMDLSGLDDGTVTFTVTSTDTGSNTATDSITATKDTLVVDVNLVTDPVNSDNETNAGASGTGEVGAGIQVFATDGTHNTTTYTATVLAGGTWSVTAMDLSGLDDGTITYMVTSTDTGGNTATDSLTAAKDTAIILLTLPGGGESGSEGGGGAAYAGAVDSALAGEDNWAL